MKHKTRLLPLAGLLLAGGILCTGCGGAAPASSAPAAVSTASSVEEVSAMDGYDYLNDYIGLWGYYDIDLWLRVHEDSTFEFVNSEDEAIYTGTADADEYGMDLYFDDDTPQMRLDLSVSGDLLEVGSSDALHPVDAIVSRATCFEKNGLEINAAVDSSDPIQLGSGVCSFTGKGSGYNTDLCYWQVTKYNDVTQTASREIQFDAVCYIPGFLHPLLWTDLRNLHLQRALRCLYRHMAHGIHRQRRYGPGQEPLLSHSVLERQRLRHRVLLLHRLEYEQHQ